MTYTTLRKSKKHLQSSTATSSWTYFERFIKATAWITFSLVILFHFTGQIAQETYYEELGVKGSLFDKNLYQIEIKGMLSVIGTFSQHLPSETQQRNFLLITLIIALCAGLVFCIYKRLDQKYPKAFNVRKKINREIEGNKSILKNFLYATSIVFAGEILLVPGTMIFLAYLCLPVLGFGAMAANYGRNEAISDLNNFKKPCSEKQQHPHYCVTLQKTNQTEIKGFLIDTSDKYIVLYDEKAKQIRISELKDATILLSSIDGTEK